jgi:hypothetical protein
MKEEPQGAWGVPLSPSRTGLASWQCSWGAGQNVGLTVLAIEGIDYQSFH